MRRVEKAACGKAAQNTDLRVNYRRLRAGSSLFHPKSRCIYWRPADRMATSHPEMEVTR